MTCGCRPEMHPGMSHEQHMDLFASRQNLRIAELVHDAYEAGRVMQTHLLIHRFAEEETARLQNKAQAMRRSWPDSEAYRAEDARLREVQSTYWRRISEIDGERKTAYMIALMDAPEEPKQLALEVSSA